MAPRDRNFLQFVPPNLRPALSEAGRVGYNILDNIIGYDDNYDTTGELLARSLREDPLGTLGAMGKGLYEGVKTASQSPSRRRETLRTNLRRPSCGCASRCPSSRRARTLHNGPRTFLFWVR
jgi:hypothetical protein